MRECDSYIVCKHLRKMLRNLSKFRKRRTKIIWLKAKGITVKAKNEDGKYNLLWDKRKASQTKKKPSAFCEVVKNGIKELVTHS